MRGIVGLLVLLPAVVTACSAPDEHRHRSVFDSAGRVLALDFGANAATRRSERLATLPAALRRELARSEGFSTPALPLGHEVAGVTRMQQRTDQLLAREIRRRPEVPADVLPDARTFGQAVADDLALLAEVLAPRRSLPEIDDRRHRTDPRDERPEASWWQRLRRRLWL